MSALLCFGGPRDGTLMSVPDDRHEWLVAVPSRLTAVTPYPDPWESPYEVVRTVRYRRERFVIPHRIPEWLGMEFECWVPEGELSMAEHRLSATFAALIGMTRLLVAP